MSARYIYAGSFCPPTYGHAEIVRKAAGIVPHLTVVCSRNPEKEYWFSEEECARMWQAYDLPDNVSIRTYDSIVKSKIAMSEMVLVRGIRGSADLADEARVIELNAKVGIDKYMIVLADEEFKEVSSSAAREAACKVDLSGLSKLVAPGVVTVLLTKVLAVKQLTMVVGPPAGGKSTLLGLAVKRDPTVVHINTDQITFAFKQLIRDRFPGRDLVEMALENDKAIQDLIGQSWLDALASELRSVKSGARVFVEVAYGLVSGKDLYRFLGADVIYIGCSNTEHHRRNAMRGTAELSGFIDKIPGRDESQSIATKNRLRLKVVDTGAIGISIDGALNSLLEEQ